MKSAGMVNGRKYPNVLDYSATDAERAEAES